MHRIAELKKLARNLTLLIVENENETKKSLQELLGDVFKEVVIQTNGLDGLETYKKIKPDIIITEIDLDEMNGAVMIKNIKKINQYAQIIILTNKKNVDDTLKMVHLGIVDFLPKPVDALLLHNALLRGLNVVGPQNNIDVSITSGSPIEALKELKETNNTEIELVSDYKGIPIIHKGTIVYIHKDYVEIQTRKIQTKVIEFNNKTIIESEHLPGDIEGKLLSIDNKNAQVALSNLKFIEYTPKRRKYSRLEPSSDMKLMAYKKGGAKIDIKLLNISVGDITFKINHLPDFFIEGSEINLKLAFEIPESDLAYYVDKLCISHFLGKIVRIIPVHNYYHVGVTFEIPKINEDVFRKYLYLRELQLIEEFKKFARGR